MKKFRRLAFEGMAHELKDPSNCKQRKSGDPKAMVEDAGDEHAERKNNGGDAERVAETVYGVLVAARILGDPLLVGAVA